MSRIVIMLKLVKSELSYLIHPKRVRQVHFEQRVVSKEVLRSISVFFIAYAVTLIPPPVLPAQAPTNISITRINLENSDHILKSTVEYPVVVMMDATWKAA